jgi:tellurite resistance-related uncharacterized protein
MSMKQLPDHVCAYKRTPEFSESTIPKGLTKAHNTKADTWAMINVLEGELIYRILEPTLQEYVLDSSSGGVIEPTVKHEVEAQHPVRFFVEFYR